MTTWEEIRNEVAGMLADGKPLEDVLAKLEQRKNEITKANLLKAMDEMKKREQTNEEWFCTLSTEDKAKWLGQRSQILYDCGQRDVFPKIMYEEDWEWWLKQPHTKKE